MATILSELNKERGWRERASKKDQTFPDTDLSALNRADHRELSFVSRTIKLGRAFGGRSLIYKALLMD